MSKKSKRHRKRKSRRSKTTLKPAPPPQIPVPPLPTVRNSPSPIGGSRGGRTFGLAAKVLGILVTILGLVFWVELFPRLSATAKGTKNLDSVLGASQFTVSNDGYLKVTGVRSVCFLWNVRTENAYLGSDLADFVRPQNSTLLPTEGFTVPCVPEPIRIIVYPSGAQPRVLHADLAIGVYYRVWPFTFYEDHRVFRFVSNIENGEVTWDKQPADALKKDFEQATKGY